MKDKKTDIFYLKNIISNCKFILNEFLNIKNKSEFIKDIKTQNAVMFSIIQIAENAKKTSEAFKESTKELEWVKMIAFRNMIIHNYDNVDLDRVYDIAKENIPKLYKSINKQFKEINNIKKEQEEVME